MSREWLAPVAMVLPALLLCACSGGSSGPTTVAPPPPDPVAAAVAVSPGTARLDAPGGTLRLSAEVRDADGNVMPDAAVTWSSDAPDVAAVDASGLVTAVGAGMATVTATAGNATGSASITVDPPVPASVTVSPATVRFDGPGGTQRLSAEVRDADGNLLPDAEVVWFSDATDVARVDADGLVTAIGAGTAVVTAKAGDEGGSATVTVEPTDPVAAAAERAALEALYERTGGERWINSTNWLSDKPFDEWYGVYQDRDGRVIGIELSDNGLTGTIPPEVGQFTELRSLGLGANGLRGGIPSEIGGLDNLETLNLVLNGLTGEIPAELSNLSMLNRLSLGGNRLSGLIPPELGRLDRAVHLGLSGNELTGPVPPEIARMGSLAQLWLHKNRLTGPIPPAFGDSRRLADLNLSGNELTGPIPPELARNSALNRLHLSDNRLSGIVPPELTALPLSFFSWSGNAGLCIEDTDTMAAWASSIATHLSGDWCNRGDRVALDALYNTAGGPGWTVAGGWDDDRPSGRHGVRVDASGRVVAIDLAGNGLAGELPLELGNLPFLETLRLDDNPDLTGRLPYTLSRLDALAEFGYAGTGLCVPREENFLRRWLGGVAVHAGTGVDCEPEADRDVLARFYEAMGGDNWSNNENWLTDAPLREWHGVTVDSGGRVIELDLWFNRLSGAIPADIAALDMLERLSIVGTDTKGAPIPPELGELANLRVLDLAGIYAAGPLPPQLGKLDRLESLDLSNNGFTGAIPAEFGNLASLKRLDLDANGLTGPIPHQLANATGLEQIHLADNDLSGTLPAALAGMASLLLLDLSGNSLSDYLPTAFGDFEQLEYLNLSFNDLFGAIPAELGNLEMLTELYLGSNSLAGSIPPELGNLSRLRSLVLTGNADLAGPLPANLANLGELIHLQAAGTKLCVSDEATTEGLAEYSAHAAHRRVRRRARTGLPHAGHPVPRTAHCPGGGRAGPAARVPHRREDQRRAHARRARRLLPGRDACPVRRDPRGGRPHSDSDRRKFSGPFGQRHDPRRGRAAGVGDGDRD